MNFSIYVGMNSVLQPRSDDFRFHIEGSKCSVNIHYMTPSFIMLWAGVSSSGSLLYCAKFRPSK